VGGGFSPLKYSVIRMALLAQETRETEFGA